NAIIQSDSNTLICGCKNTIIPPSVTEIGDGAFFGCSSLTSISIPPSVTEIGHSAFFGCSNLTSISIPSSVTEIGHSAFSRCSNLTSISIPKGCEVEENTFLDCPKNIVITRY
ncbi:MAG: leucine-rich repeat domain-containing protein, partial [Bacteroidaceae bacterium]|nr:leucine-rich repeat domain-containing protein [Bacteroidaceae bacterium]